MNYTAMNSVMSDREGAGFSAGDQVCLSNFVRTAVESYFRDLGGHSPGNLYEMVMAEVERPLLETVMQQVHGNQTRAAKMLGMNRSTLRKKLAHYGLHE